jgi:hypothetical protein
VRSAHIISITSAPSIQQHQSIASRMKQRALTAEEEVSPRSHP